MHLIKSNKGYSILKRSKLKASELVIVMVNAKEARGGEPKVKKLNY